MPGFSDRAFKSRDELSKSALNASKRTWKSGIEEISRICFAFNARGPYTAASRDAKVVSDSTIFPFIFSTFSSYEENLSGRNSNWRKRLNKTVVRCFNCFLARRFGIMLDSLSLLAFTKTPITEASSESLNRISLIENFDICSAINDSACSRVADLKNDVIAASKSCS